MTTVLVTGTDGGAGQSIVKCLRMAKHYRIITVGVDPLCIGIYRGNKGYVVSRDWNEYKMQIMNICKKEHVDIIIPGSDIELEHFAQEREFYETCCPPVLIDYEIVPIARDKVLTAKKLAELGFSVPKTWLKLADVDKFPVILKPVNGYGSNYFFKNVTKDLLYPLAEYIRRAGYVPMAQEQLEGTEYSCMTLSARDGELLACTVAKSVKKYGQSYKTIIEPNSELEDYVSRISKALNAKGPLSIQLIDTAEGPKVFELNARFTGAQIVRAYAGVNGPDLLVKNWLTGEKEYPKIQEKLVAFWYHDFAYLPYEEFKTVEKEGKTKKRMCVCPKYL